MRYLLDTSVISEFRKTAPNPAVLDWLNQIEPETVYLSVITVGELQKGIERLDAGPRKGALQAWLAEDLPARFAGRIVVLDIDVLRTWGTLLARLERSGKVMPVIDALIAATALHGGFTLVTRNVADFAHSGVKVHNPWG